MELFHLVFLRALVAKGEDKSLFALKGGCNLRFFFRSVRYSEDMDLDVVVVSKETLKRKVDRLLDSPAVVAPLKTWGIELVEVSAPKQTDATQRWKAGLRSVQFPAPLRTKIELSRRRARDSSTFDAVDPELLRRYGLSPFLATHYPLAAALAQKVDALAGRAVPQARDVFDLNHLLSLGGPEATRLAVDASNALRAIENAKAITYDEYSAQVVSYLDPAQRELFESRDAWNTMKSAVLSRLERVT
ncbi:MAG: nucleotidyl transferase AbiEii/AbiGii toxin family protein [Polyangiaceae bacterium]